MFEGHEGRDAQSDGQGKQADACQPRRRCDRSNPAVSGEDDLMKQGRGNQEADADQHHHKPRTMHMPGGVGDIREALLEDGLELESEQHLGSKDQEP